MPGYPDWQKIQQWIGSPLVEQTGFAIGNSTHDDGPFNLASWASVIVALKPTGGDVTVTIKQKISGGPSTLELDESEIVHAGVTSFESFVLFGDVVTLELAGSAPGTVVDYALIPANTTTNAQVITNATIDVQHNDALVAAEQAIDFVDANGAVWSVVDDGPNTRVKISLNKLLAVQHNEVAVATEQAIDFVDANGIVWTITDDGAGNRVKVKIGKVIAVQHNDVAVATEQAIDFEDAAGFVWTVADDAGNNRVKVTPPDLTSAWVALSGSFTYSSTDGHTFVVNTPSDLRTSIGPGDRFQCVQSGVTQYLIVTAISATQLTLYGGTSYSLANVAISSPYYSHAKVPFGFNPDPTIWQEKSANTSDDDQSTPTTGTWYNVGTQSLAVPIGSWLLGYSCATHMHQNNPTLASGDYSWMKCTLSTANNSESDTEFSVLTFWDRTNAYNNAALSIYGYAAAQKPVVLAAKTSYYLNAQRVSGSADQIGFRGSGNYQPRIIRAVCAYL